MWTLSWFLDLLGEEAAERAAALGLSRESYLEREAEAVPAGSDGLMTILDWLAPTDRPYRKGVMLGFDARHTRGHVYRSILEAIALTMKAQRGRDGRGARHRARRDRRLGRRLLQPAVHAASSLTSSGSPPRAASAAAGHESRLGDLRGRGDGSPS